MNEYGRSEYNEVVFQERSVSLVFFFRSFLPYFFLFGEGSVVFFVKETQTREWNILSSIRLCNAIDTHSHLDGQTIRKADKHRDTIRQADKRAVSQSFKQADS